MARKLLSSLFSGPDFMPTALVSLRYLRLVALVTIFKSISFSTQTSLPNLLVFGGDRIHAGNSVAESLSI
jgi:hypothetical protein